MGKARDTLKPTTKWTNNNNNIMYPYGLTTDLNGFVIVSGTCSQHIEVFDKDGNLVKSHALTGRNSNVCNTSTRCTYPLAIASSPDSKVWMTFTNESFVQKLTQDDFPIR